MDDGNYNGEPSTAPDPNHWYDITLGPSLLSDGHSYSPRFCTLRYEFKPASIDNTQPGSFHKSKENRVTLEFQNNQPGKPKVRFDGVSKDYNDKDKDAILFFDGQTFRLEKLHRAVKRLKYLRVPGESAAAKVVPPVKLAQIDINNPVSLDNENEEDPFSSEEEVNIEQEVVGDGTTALQCVLNTDIERTKLLEEEVQILAKQREMELVEPTEKDGTPPTKDTVEADLMSQRLEEIYKRLDAIDAYTAEARAASILAGLSFTPEMQKKATNTFSGGWRMRIALARS